MSIVLRLCFSLVVLAPSLIHAATLGIPRPGTTLSGIGVISGWKCQADGKITVEFLNKAAERLVIRGGRISNPVPMVYGAERTDVRDNGQCLENAHDNVGFVAIWNWGELGDGTYTAVAYDNGVEFDRSTFTVVGASEEESFVRDVVAECTVPDFPDAGTNARFEWSTGTQHLELAEVGEDVVVPVSTRFDGEWDLAFTVWQNPFGAQSNCSGVCKGVLTGALTVQNGLATSVEMECLGGESHGVFWYAIIRPNGHLEGSYGTDLSGEFATIGSWDGLLGSDGGQWFDACGHWGTWEAVRSGNS